MLFLERKGMNKFLVIVFLAFLSHCEKHIHNYRRKENMGFAILLSPFFRKDEINNFSVSILVLRKENRYRVTLLPNLILIDVDDPSSFNIRGKD